MSLSHGWFEIKWALSLFWTHKSATQQAMPWNIKAGNIALSPSIAFVYPYIKSIDAIYKRRALDLRG